MIWTQVPRRIIAKAILRIISHDIEEAAGPLQVCAGQEGGCEAAVHAMRESSKNQSRKQCSWLMQQTHSMLSTGWPLSTTSVSCPPLAQILINTYRAPIRMIIPGNGEISSSEGTTQGDPLAMAMYALAISPLIDQLRTRCPNVQQVWFADDATGAASCSNLRSWWDTLSSRGPAFGYHQPDPKIEEHHPEREQTTPRPTGAEHL